MFSTNKFQLNYVQNGVIQFQFSFYIKYTLTLLNKVSKVKFPCFLNQLKQNIAKIRIYLNMIYIKLPNLLYTAHLIINNKSEINKQLMSIKILKKTIINTPLFLIIALLCFIAKTNYILSVNQTNSIVNANNMLAISIKTTTTIGNNSLILYFDQTYTIDNTTCKVNTTVISCSLKYNATTSLYSITLGVAFSINTTTTLYVNVINPYYSNNFQITATNVNSAFLTSGTVIVSPKSINSTLTGLSSQVGAQTIGIFSLNNDLIPTNSIIYIQSATQTIFKNLFTSSVMCMINNISLPCTVTTLFGNQILQISSVPANTNIIINVTSINNPPYNNTFIPIQVQIQDSLNRLMQTSNFTQNPPTTLATSNNVILNNWNNTIGAISSNSFYISTYFNTIANESVMIEFNSNLIITPNSPAIYSQTNIGNRTRILISNATLGSSSIQFSTSIQNPSWIQPLSITVYLLFNNNSFMQQFSIPSPTMMLQGYTSNVSNTLTSNLIGVLTTGNFTFGNLNSILNQGIIIQLSLQYGKFYCQSINLSSSISGLTVQSCNDSVLVLNSTSNLNIMTYWLTYSVLNHFSVQPYSILFTFKTLVSNYAISTGSAGIQLLSNSLSATILNSNTQLGKTTNISISQSLSTIQLNFSNYLLNTQVQRIFTIYPPTNLIINSNTSIVVLNSSVCQIISVIQFDITLIKLQISGYLSIKILNISKDQILCIFRQSSLLHYRYNIFVILQVVFYYNSGQRAWNITTYDTSNYLSQVGSNILQTPDYTSTTSSFMFSLENNTIQQQTKLNLTILPQLQYSLFSTPPSVNIILSDSQILSLVSCPSSNCTLVSSKQLFILYFNPTMELILNIKNSNYPAPINQTIFVSIYIGNFIYQSLVNSYTLKPLQFGYIQTFAGLYQQIGVLIINITSAPSQYTNLTYTGINQIMQSSPSCQACNSTLINLTGKVIYFQKAILIIYGVSLINQTNVTFAISNIQIKYPCSSIQGCRICTNNTDLSTGSINLVCSKCFDSTLTNLTLLYHNQCLDFCPISTYSTGVSCMDCQAFCYNCTATTCLECDSGYFLLNTSCMATCPSGYIHNLTHCFLIPIICPSNCVDCPVNNQCNKCSSGYYLLSNLCYSKCPAGYKASSSNYGICKTFIPPQQAKYYPFAFLIVSLLILIVLAIIKCFEKRSLMMGNFIAFMSLLQFATVTVTLSYTFLQLNQALWTQALIFVVVLSKISLNLIFLIYFMVRVSKQDQFINWKEKQQINSKIYKILIVFSTIMSFQVLRIIYSRLLGFQIFFGKFSSSLIFKPMNYFSLSYALTFSSTLIILCLSSILDQEGYKTIVYYTCIQTILIQSILLISCLIQSQRSGADQFFDYQIYKVQNQFEEGSFNPIVLTSQKQAGGSNQDMIKFYKKMQNSNKKVSSRNWRRKTTAVSQQLNCANQSMEQINESPSFQQDKTRMNIFRVKFLKDWKQIEKTLPKTNIYKMRKSHQYISMSPNSKKNIKKDLQKSSSVQKIEVKIPQYTSSSIGEKIKNYFHIIDQNNSQSKSIAYDNKTQKRTNYEDIKTNKPSNNNFSQKQGQLNHQNQNQKDNKGIFDNRKSPLQDQLLEQNQFQQISDQEYLQKNKTNLQDMLQRFSENNISQHIIHNYEQQFSNRKLQKSPGKIIHQSSFDENVIDFKDGQSKQIEFNQKSIQILNNNFTNFKTKNKKQRVQTIGKEINKLKIESLKKQDNRQKSQSKNRNNSRTKRQQVTQRVLQDEELKTNSFSKRSRSKGQRRRVNKQTQSVYLQRLANTESNQNPKKINKRYKELSDF